MNRRVFELLITGILTVLFAGPMIPSDDVVDDNTVSLDAQTGGDIYDDFVEASCDFDETGQESSIAEECKKTCCDKVCDIKYCCSRFQSECVQWCTKCRNACRCC